MTTYSIDMHDVVYGRDDNPDTGELSNLTRAKLVAPLVTVWRQAYYNATFDEPSTAMVGDLIVDLLHYLRYYGPAADEVNDDALREMLLAAWDNFENETDMEEER